jgi:hypothetical protein
METKFNFKSAVCTSREQSEKLLALGLKKETADMCWIEEWGYDDDKRETFCTGNYFVRPIDYVWDDKYINYIPAWSLHRMLCMLTTKRKCLLVRIEADLYDVLIDRIEREIKEGCFPKEYLV